MTRKDMCIILSNKIKCKAHRLQDFKVQAILREHIYDTSHSLD